MNRRNWLEWLVLVVSLVAVAGMVGVLLADGLTDRGRPPDPAVELHADEAYAGASGWLVPATVANHGDRAARSVQLVATAMVAGSQEEAQVTVDYLPPGSEVEVTFGFSARPDDALSVQVAGFVP